MSKELRALKNDLLAKLSEAKAETGEQLKTANDLWTEVRNKIAVLQEESREASRLLSIALKADMEAAKELKLMENGGERTYAVKPPPPPPERVRTHRRIVRARNAELPPSKA